MSTLIDSVIQEWQKRIRRESAWFNATDKSIELAIAKVEIKIAAEHARDAIDKWYLAEGKRIDDVRWKYGLPKKHVMDEMVISLTKWAPRKI